MPPLRILLALSCLLFVLLFAAVSGADDCPPGSVFKSQDGFTWCEPTVCQNDGQCHPNEVCRPIALCMQVGTLAAGAVGEPDASKRLVVTQRCAPDKTCPQSTVCSDMGRCLSKAAAEKMGTLVTGSASPAASSGTGAEKKSCACHVVGGDAGSTGGAAFALALALLSVRRVRAGRRVPPP